MKTRYFNIFLFILLLPCPAGAEEALTPVNFKGIYECSFGGIALGTMGIEVAQTPDHYSMESDITTTGLLRLFVQHQSHATVEASGAHFSYPNITYETHYQTRKKKHYIKMVHKDGALTQEEEIPPDPPGKRPQVPMALKKTAADPLSFLIRMRQEVWKTRQKGGSFSINVYDGNRLTEADFTVVEKTTLRDGDRKIPVIKLGLRRKMMAGYTPKELDDYDPREPTLYVYFTDDARLLPIRVETTYLMTPLVAVLAKECRTGESCLLGIRE